MPCRVSNADPSCAAAAAAAASHLQAPSCSSSNSSSPASLHALYPTVQMVQSAHGGITTSMSNQTAAAAAAAAAGGNGGIGIANGYVQLQQQQHQPPTSPLPTGEHREHFYCSSNRPNKILLFQPLAMSKRRLPRRTSTRRTLWTRSGTASRDSRRSRFRSARPPPTGFRRRSRPRRSRSCSARAADSGCRRPRTRTPTTPSPCSSTSESMR